MQTVNEMIQQIQAITYEAYKSSGQAATLLGEPASSPEAVAKAMEQATVIMEQGTVELRALCESCLPELLTIGRKPVLPPLDVAGSVSVCLLSQRIPGAKLCHIYVLPLSEAGDFFSMRTDCYSFFR